MNNFSELNVFRHADGIFRRDSGGPSLDEERVNYGLGEILTDLANAIASPIDSD